jgi:hypothetical protein
VGAPKAPTVNAVDVFAVENEAGVPPLGVTVKVSAEPFVSPVIAHVCVAPTVPTVPPVIGAQIVGLPASLVVTVYVVEIPSAAKETVAAPVPFPATVGATRGVPSVTATVAGASVSALDDKWKPAAAIIPAAGFVTPATTSVVTPAVGEQVPLRVTVTT